MRKDVFKHIDDITRDDFSPWCGSGCEFFCLFNLIRVVCKDNTQKELVLYKSKPYSKFVKIEENSRFVLSKDRTNYEIKIIKNKNPKNSFFQREVA